MYAYSRRMPSKIIVIVLCVCLLAVSFLRCARPQKVEGAAIATALSLTGYVMTAVGALDLVTAGGVRRVASNVYDSVKEKIADLMGTGIYEDSTGNYVFSESASQEIYDLLNANPGIDARVVSDFPDPIYVNNLYVTPDFKSMANNVISNYGNQVLIQSLGYRTSTMFSECYIYDISNVAYFAFVGHDYIYFYNASGNTISVNYTSLSQTYNFTSGVYSGISKTSSLYNSVYYYYDGTNEYLNFPNKFYDFYSYSNKNGQYSFYCSRSLILGQNSSFGMALYSKDSGTVVNNDYNVIPSVSKSVIENNDWDSIYNSYVTNVDNQKNVYYTDSEGFDMPALRNVMKNYGDAIYSAIEEGATDISDRVNYLNSWMERIYDRVTMIYDWLSSGGSSASGSGSSGNDYSAILSTLSSTLSLVLTGVNDVNTNLLNIYAYFDDLLDAINNLNSGTASDGTPNITINNVAADMVAISTDGIDGFLGQTQVFTSVAKAVAPLCYLVVLSTILQGLSARPPDGYAPSWVIPFRLQKQGVIDVNEDVTVDLSGFESVHTVLIAMECLAFIIFLVFITFRLLKIVLDIFS